MQSREKLNLNMKKKKEIKANDSMGLKLDTVKPYKIRISKKLLVDEKKIMESESMRIANKVLANLVLIDDWGEEADKHPEEETANGKYTDWQKRIMDERFKEFHKNREQLELEEGILRRYQETEDCFFI